MNSFTTCEPITAEPSRLSAMTSGTSNGTDSGTANGFAMGFVMGRLHARRLRDVYRSAGWPCQDKLEVELLAAQLLERFTEISGHDKVRLTDKGIAHLAQAFQQNRQARSRHEALVEQVALTLQRDGRIVWTGLSLRAHLPTQADEPAHWKVCMPDVFSIRNTTVAGYMEPIVHEIKVNRADLLSDLKSPDKRAAYLAVGGQCWYVLGSDRQDRPIGQADEIPDECGVMTQALGRLHVVRSAPKRSVADLPFSMWMALAKATPMLSVNAQSPQGPCQAVLIEQPFFQPPSHACLSSGPL